MNSILWPFDMKARFRQIVELIQSQSLERVRERHKTHLGCLLWEMRMKERDGISRAIYITPRGCRVIVARIFVKNTRKC